jgi:hypothetical protein
MRSVIRLLVPFVSLAAGAGVVALHGGCGPSAPVKETTVRGRVTFQGRPVADGTVVFAPDPDRGATGKPLRAATAADGTFTLRPPEGAVPAGWYRVALAPAPGEVETDPPFPPQLRRPDRSGVVREVRVGADNVFELAVEVSSAGDGTAARVVP